MPNFKDKLKTTSAAAAAEFLSRGEENNISSNEEKNVSTNEEKNVSNNEEKNVETNQTNNLSSKEQNNVRRKEENKKTTNEETRVERKRVSFDLRTDLHKSYKRLAVDEDRNIYEMIEEAMDEWLERRKQRS